MPGDFINVFEHSVSDFNLDLLSTIPWCMRINDDDDDEVTHIDLEEGCVTDSQLAEAYEACMNTTSALLSDQSSSNPTADNM